MAMSRPVKRTKLDSESEESDTGGTMKAPAVKKSHGAPTSTQYSSSGSSSESDDEWTVGGPSIGGGGGKKSKKSRPSLGRPSGKRMAGWPKGGGGGKRSSATTSSDEDSDDFTLNKVSHHQSSSASSDSDDEEDSGSEESLQFDDGLGEDLVGDEEDMRKLNDMTEAERELELFKRHEQREALKARFEIERKLIQEKKQLQKEKKKKKEVRQQKSHRRISLRAKRYGGKEDKTTKAIDELRANRTADKQRKAAEAEQQQHRREPLKASDVFSNSSEESSSDSSDDDDGDSSADEPGPGDRSLGSLKASALQPIRNLDQLNKIKLSRFRLEKWVHMPFFAEVIKGCFVKLGIGQHEGKMVYRVCEIIAVQETPKIYNFGGSRTNKGLKVRHGTQERVFRMEFVSNSPFSDSEFSKWKTEMETKGIPLPTTDFVERKIKEIDSKKRFVLKDDDIDKIIHEKKRFQKNPHNYALTKSRLMREKEVADTYGETDKATGLAKQLEELEERAEELDRQRSKGLSAISYINERNRQRNVARAEEALKEEMAKIKESEEDPFTRRKCNPRLVTFAKDSQGNAGMIEVSPTKAQDSSAVSAALDTPSRDNGAESAELFVESTPTVSATPIPDKPDVKDLFSAHDFDIQIDLPSSPRGQSEVKMTPKATPPPKNDGPRRSLNLSDYKKRRGLI